jgi:DNA polymerase-3 subunit gamma/tau
MAHLALFRKYRSQSFDQLSGQDHVTVTLRNALRMRRAGQAYMFCGPRGTGKTSTARIFAKALNCVGPDGSLTEPPEQPCNQCPLCERITGGSCLDVSEMDAASNTGVDNIRDAVIGKADFAPVEGRRKVYIIDEVHKLSSAAFAALLKTLEEPPPHLVFILATTDPHDVPATILSRCQRFDFRRIAPRDIVARLVWICGEEGLEAESDALTMIAEAADGSLRDALVILEQAAAFSEGRITAATMTSLLGVTDKSALFRLSGHLLSGETAEALGLLDALVLEGRDLVGLARDLLGHVRALLIANVAGAARTILKVPDEQFERLAAQAKTCTVPDLMRAARVLMELEQELKDPIHARLNWEVAIIRVAAEAGAFAQSPRAGRGGGPAGGDDSGPPRSDPPAALSHERAAPPPGGSSPHYTASPSPAPGRFTPGSGGPAPGRFTPGSGGPAPEPSAPFRAEPRSTGSAPESGARPSGDALHSPPAPPASGLSSAPSGDPLHSSPAPPACGFSSAPSGDPLHSSPAPPASGFSWAPSAADPLHSPSAPSPSSGGPLHPGPARPAGRPAPPSTGSPGRDSGHDRPSPHAPGGRAASVGGGAMAEFRDAWPHLLESLKRDKMTPLHGVLLEARPLTVEGDTCVLGIGAKFNFHRERIEAKKAEIASRLSALLQRAVRVEVRVHDGPAPGLSAPAPPGDPSDPKQAHQAFVQESLDLFGGKIV